MRQFKACLGVMLVLSAVMGLEACVAEAPHEEASIVHLAFDAAFAPLTSVTLYDARGNVVAELVDELSVDVPSGVYYADIRDDYNNGVFDEGGRLLFAPALTGGQLELAPHPVPGVEIPLVEISTECVATHTDTGAVIEALHTTGADPRGRLVWEAARAMVGAGSAGSHTWGTTTTLATSPYVSEDTGAWNSVRSLYMTNVSCRADDDVSNNYIPCSIAYGADVAGIYACQGYCPAGQYRGGQCKAFMNLVAYRSGVHHGTGSSFRMFASDSVMDLDLTNYPMASSATIQAGDLLRRSVSTGNPHAAIVVRVVDSNVVVVVDSNWVGGGNGYETVGSHTLSFALSGISNPSTYHRLNCVYAGTC